MVPWNIHSTRHKWLWGSADPQKKNPPCQKAQISKCSSLASWPTCRLVNGTMRPSNTDIRSRFWSPNISLFLYSLAAAREWQSCDILGAAKTGRRRPSWKLGEADQNRHMFRPPTIAPIQYSTNYRSIFLPWRIFFCKTYVQHIWCSKSSKSLASYIQEK